MEKEVKHFDWEDTAPCEYEPPRPEEEIADDHAQYRTTDI